MRNQRAPSIVALLGLWSVALLLSTTTGGRTAHAQPNAFGSGDQFKRQSVLSRLGTTSGYRFFALETRTPAGWAKSSYASVTDPNTLTRLVVEDRRVPLGLMLGKQRYYQHRIFVELWLTKPTNLRQALTRWMARRLKNLLLASSYQKWPVTWLASQFSEYKLAGGRRLLMLMRMGGSRPSQHVAPLGLTVVGALLVGGTHVALFGTGFTRDSTFNGLSAQARQWVLQGFTSVTQQTLLVASLGHLKLPRRDAAMERSLALKRRFLHASRYSSQMGAVSTTHFAQYRRLDIRFRPGRTCTLRDDFSSLYQHTQRSLLDAPGSDPRSRTHQGGGARKSSPRSRCEVRRRGAERWLVVYLKSGPTFYTLEPQRARRCGKRSIRGVAIGGLVEGVFSTYRGWCVYTPVHKARLH